MTARTVIRKVSRQLACAHSPVPRIGHGTGIPARFTNTVHYFPSSCMNSLTT